MKNAFKALLTLLLAVASIPSIAFTIDTSHRTPANVEGLWWNSTESGWGATLTQQGNIIFATIFTYDANGDPIWYVASNCPISAGGCSGDLYRVNGGRPITSSWAGATVGVTAVGRLTLAFADNNTGTMTLSVNGVSNSKSIVRQIFAGPPTTPPVDINRQRVEQLVGGTWSFSYTIISRFTDEFRFTSVQATNLLDSGWVARGTDEFGNSVSGTYDPTLAEWAVLDEGIIIDQFYTFTFTDLNRVTGCYHQISPSGSTNLSRCYDMVGVRFPPKSMTMRTLRERVAKEEAAMAEGQGSASVPMEPRMRLLYEGLRHSRLGK